MSDPTPGRHWQLNTVSDDYAELVIDVRDAPANTLSRAVMAELNAWLDELQAVPPRGLVIRSGKPGGFIAGADVHEFTRIRDRDEALAVIRLGQSTFERIAALPFPTLALIRGHCLGGGLELAMACDYRIAVDDPATRLALPEVKLGIHPGFGGTVRAIDLAGSLKGLEVMLTGRSLSARQARRLGLVDEALPERVCANAIHHYMTARPARRSPPRGEALLRCAPLRPLVAAVVRRQTRRKANPAHYPAPFALIDLWRRHAGDARAMLTAEAESVATLITGETSRNLVRVFELQNRLKALGKQSDFRPRHVHVVGAGTMGGDIAAWCALQGSTVTVEDANGQALASTVQRADRLFRRRLRDYPRRLTEAADRLLPDPHGHGRRRADVIIEAIFEDEAAKQALFAELERQVRPDTLLATNTSSIPLERIAAALQNGSRLVGLHFFNPVAKMPLVEVVHQADTPEPLLQQAMALCRRIDKLPLPVRSSPGFLVNRILMPYLLEAALLLEEGFRKEAIDLAATDSGMPVGPLELADVVGLDICLHVAEVLAGPMGLPVPRLLRERVTAGKLGRKRGEGFYRWVKGRPQRAHGRVQVDRHLQERLIGKLLDEARRCLDDGIVADADLVDAGVIFGTGFAPFRGGPLHYLATRGTY